MQFAKNGHSTLSTVPRHLAIIMDGNHRWARQQGLPGSVGHRVGAKNVRPIAEYCADLGVTYLTLFAFSTENWARPKHEIDLLFELIRSTLNQNIQELHERDTRVRYIGNLSRFPLSLRKLLHESEMKTANNRSLTLSIALNYGGRSEIAQATRRIGLAVQNGELDAGCIDENTIEDFLDSDGIPNPDFCIRTGGDQRLSNFLLWQLAYTELYFSKTYWPDFSKEELVKAIRDYGSRDRRFGRRLEQEVLPLAN
ncbi:MAG: polyprenyl diphosphate synthase [Gammaproteobacteria bacterium]|nr:polyprenyl diphosphate synthase [Gammaproteobacteria bacterium]